MKPFLIAVAGGTGAGKTSLVNVLVSRLGEDRVTHIQHDSYYRNLSHLPFEQRVRQNFDHPDSLETALLVRHLKGLKAGEEMSVPEYDFVEHTRKPGARIVEPRPFVLVEGILILVDPELSALMDLRIFVDADPDIRLIRRITRDVAERGRTLDSVLRQYLETVRPMHLQFVEPSQGGADLVVSGVEDLQQAADQVLERLANLSKYPVPSR